MATVKPDVRVFDNLLDLSQAAAAIFAGSCADAVRARGRALVALSGGNTPSKLFEMLAGPPFAERIDWPHVHAFWADERCVPPDDPESNYRQAYDALLSRVMIPPQNIHRVDGETPPREAALEYALTLKTFASPPLSWPRFDLVLLGMGDDGHTASLFPGTPVNIQTPTAAVTAHYEDRPADRVTLTPILLNAARKVIFLVSGDSKSQTLANVLHGKSDPLSLPAQRIHPTDGDLIWMVDRAAAGKL